MSSSCRRCEWSECRPERASGRPRGTRDERVREEPCHRRVEGASGPSVGPSVRVAGREGHPMTLRLDTVERAITDFKAGRAVVVDDDEDRENEGDLIFAAELATPELVAFMVRYTSGYICVPMTEGEADRLDLPPMFRVNQDRR